MRQYCFARVCLALAPMLILGFGEARAQISPVGSPVSYIAAAVRGNGIAYDPKNKVYLTVATYGLLRGQFVSQDGAPVGSTFVIQSGGSYTHFPSVAYSPDADGGAGGFLVVWHASDLAGERTSIHARMVSVNHGGPFSADNQVGADSSFYEAPVNVAYSKPAQSFMVVWGTKETANVSGVIVNNSGAAASGILPVATTGDGERWAGVACHDSKPECLVSYSGWSSNAFVRSVLLNARTGIVDGASFAQHRRTSGIWQTDTVFNSLTGEYLVVWYQEPGNGLYATRVAAGSGTPTSGILTVSTRFASKDSVDLAYNPAAGTTLYVSHDLLSTSNDGAVEIDAAGNPISASSILVLPTNQGNYYPSVAANPARSEWMALTSHRFQALYGQRITTTSVGSPAPPSTPAPTPPLPPPAAPPCSYDISTKDLSVSAGSAGGKLTVTAVPTGCVGTWTAESASGFITLSPSDNTVSYGIAANPSSLARRGTATIAGHTLTVDQAGLPCTYTLDASSITISAEAVTGTLAVSTPQACRWDAASQSGFITFSNATGRTDSGTLQIHVSRNFATPGRTGTATIAGQTFSVTQGGAPVNEKLWRPELARADFNGDGYNDLLWRDSTHGYIAAWHLQGGHTTKEAVSVPIVVDDPDWEIVGTGNFERAGVQDGKPDIVWQHRREGWIYLWYMDGVHRYDHTYLTLRRMPSAGWKVVGVGDFNFDGKPDLLWQHPTDRWLSLWLVDGTRVTNVPLSPGRIEDALWQIAGVGDFNADGHSDILWRHREGGSLGVWLMNQGEKAVWVPLDPAAVGDREWQIAAVIDVNGDQTPDLVWHHISNGWVAVWYMNGTSRADHGSFPVIVDLNWKLVGPK
ncbi:MAG TPA: FG-GAP-like repeat-containing protein [Gemmatimonadaceae bacterium]|nr:FG-GAP-like repeat-containing protein [Gemmatimonadaceae bacterium]